MAYLDDSGVQYLWGKIKALIPSTSEVESIVADEITTGLYTFRGSWSAGAAGSRGDQKSASVTKSGYKVIAVSISYISDSSTAIIVPFMSNDGTTLYCNFYRADTSAHSNVETVIKVVYKKT